MKMKTYIGTKTIQAKPESQNNQPGYAVLSPDGCRSWSPEDVFEDAYREADGMSFGLAIEAMKRGLKVARKGWNGKGMFCIYVPGTIGITFRKGTPYAEAVGIEPNQEILPHIDMYTVNSEGRRAMLPGWLASQTDMLADDWGLVLDVEPNGLDGLDGEQ